MKKELSEKVIPLERMAILQGFVEYYLLKTKGKTFKEVYPDVPDKYALLNKKQEELLHFFLEDYYNDLGVDLGRAMKLAGAEPVPGGLSDFERNELARLADKEILIFGSIMKRKNELLKK